MPASGRDSEPMCSLLCLTLITSCWDWVAVWVGVFLVSRSWYLSLTTAVRHSESKRKWRKNTCHTETYLSSWDSAHPWEARLNPDKRIWCKAHPVLRTERKLGTGWAVTTTENPQRMNALGSTPKDFQHSEGRGGRTEFEATSAVWQRQVSGNQNTSRNKQI